MEVVDFVFVVESFQRWPEAEIRPKLEIQGLGGIVAVKRIGAVVQVGGTVILKRVLSLKAELSPPHERPGPIQVGVKSVAFAGGANLTYGAGLKSDFRLLGLQTRSHGLGGKSQAIPFVIDQFLQPVQLP